MPSRIEPFINNNIYHIYNKSIDDRIIFNKDCYCNYFLSIAQYYRSGSTRLGYSQLSKLNSAVLESYLQKINDRKTFQVQILAYCLMPTHYHLLIKQIINNGISHYMANIINSFTRYFNLNTERKGPIFFSDFKSVKINSEVQFTHVSRYIHLNPYSAGYIKSYKDLKNYLWSSLKNYAYGTCNEILSTKDLMMLFNNDRERYIRFVLSNAEYQKTLNITKNS